jgi:lysozyme
MKTISQQCVDIVKHFEGLFLKAYKCPAGVWTIGWGHTGLKHNDGTVRAGRVITKAQAEELLRADLNGKYAPGVARLLKVRVTQAQFDALVSFHFNTGALGKSTLLKRINEGKMEEAAEQFVRWTKARDPKTGQRVELRGLVRRRRAERALFLGGDWRAAAVTW